MFIGQNRRGRATRKGHLVVVMATVSGTLGFFSGQLAHLKRKGFEFILLSSAGPSLEEVARREGAVAVALHMTRQITPLRDLIGLVRLIFLFRRLRPDIVHAHTPKAGFLGVLAATLARVPVRIYQIHGAPAVTATGLRRAALSLCDRAAAQLASEAWCVSPSLLDALRGSSAVYSRKCRVLGNGTVNGVDVYGRMRADDRDLLRRSMRTSMGIDSDAPVIGFVGRITRDKGIEELWLAWQAVRTALPRARLLLVGPEEPSGRRDFEVIQLFRHDSRVVMPGRVRDVAGYYAAMDLLVFPSYREGFGMVALEAAAMRLPVLASRIPGIVDAVKDGVTGTLVRPGDVQELEAGILRYLADRELRRRHGNAGFERVCADFLPEEVWSAVEARYRSLIARCSDRSEIAVTK